MSDSARPASGNANSAPQYRLITAKQLGDVLAVSERTIWRLDSAGEVPKPIRIGGSVRWLSSEITLWIKAGCPDRRTWEQMKKNRNQD